MKNQFLKSNWWMMSLSVILLLQVSCIPENSEPTDLVDQSLTLEKSIQETDPFPLENLRMNPTTLQMLAELRESTAKYHDIEVAMEDGYVGSDCVADPDLGGMGYHYVNYAIVDGVFDPTEPEALVYEPMKNGKLRLVAIEFIVVSGPWDEENDGPPMLGSKEFDDHREIIIVDGEPVNAKGGPPFPHYQLHTWVWKHNPSGLYAPFNPNVTCQYSE